MIESIIEKKTVWKLEQQQKTSTIDSNADDVYKNNGDKLVCAEEYSLKFSKKRISIWNVRFKSYLRFMKEPKKNKNQDPVPTKTELDVLQVLWSHGPSTVRLVHDILNTQKKAVQYTSTLKLMQVMVEKGMLSRDESSMKHVYRPILGEEKTKSFMLGRFVDSMYNGSVSNLVLALMENEKTSRNELQLLKDLAKKLADGKQ